MDMSMILLTYSSLVLTVIGGILSFILYHFVPMKAKVERIWNDLYGKNGHIDEFEEDTESLRKMLERTHQQHEDLRSKLDRVILFLDHLSEYLDDHAPHIHEDDYVEDDD